MTFTFMIKSESEISERDFLAERTLDFLRVLVVKMSLIQEHRVQILSFSGLLSAPSFSFLSLFR